MKTLKRKPEFYLAAGFGIPVEHISPSGADPKVTEKLLDYRIDKFIEDTDYRSLEVWEGVVSALEAQLSACKDILAKARSYEGVYWDKDHE